MMCQLYHQKDFKGVMGNQVIRKFHRYRTQVLSHITLTQTTLMLSREIILPFPAALDLALTGPFEVQAEDKQRAKDETNKSVRSWYKTR